MTKAAKEMFAELGYTLQQNIGMILVYEKELKTKKKVIIVFYKHNYQTSWKKNGEEELHPISINKYLNAAIQQQLKELGWLDD